jgi:hypothetical protein
MQKLIFLLVLCLTVIGSAYASTITLTSPNGGENWTKGSTHDITWTYTACPDSYNVSLYLVKEPWVGVIALDKPIGSAGQGSFKGWVAGQTDKGIACGSGYHVVIKVEDQGVYLNYCICKDSSNAAFAINCMPVLADMLRNLSFLKSIKWSAGGTDSIVLDLKELLSKLGNPDQTETLALDILKEGRLFATIGKFGQGNRLLERQQVKLSSENLRLLQGTSSGFQLRVMDARGKILLVQNILLTK